MERMSVLGGVDRRRLVLIGLIGAVTIAVLVVLAGGKAALDAVVKANWAFLGLAVLVHYSSFALRGHRWQRLLGALGYPLPYLYTTGLLLAGWFASALLPARAGDWLRVGVLRLDTERHEPVPVPSSLSSLVLERVLDILAILILGAAFGFLANTHESFRELFFLSMPPVALLIILAILRGVPEDDRWTVTALSLVFGGAIGNYIDRVRFRYVIDFLDFHIQGKYTWPAFNIADSAIVVGVGVLLYLELVRNKSKTADKESAKT